MKYAILVEADARIFLYRLNFLFTSEDLMKIKSSNVSDLEYSGRNGLAYS